MTNFLQTFGVSPQFQPVPPQMLAARQALLRPAILPLGVDIRTTTSWLLDISQRSRRARYWDLEKATVPIRMYFAVRPGLASPAEQVILSAYTDDTLSPQASLWLEYFRGPMRR